MADTAAPVPTPPEEENPFAARLQADPSLGEVSVTERVRLNFNDARYRGTLLGAGSVLKLPEDAKGGQEVTDEFGNPIGTAPPSAVAADRYDAITADLLRYEATPSFTGAGEMTGALIGQLGGGMLSPEAFITRVPGLSSVVERFFPKAVQAGASVVGREVSEEVAQAAGRVASAGVTQGAVQGAVNPAIQAAEMQSGLRDEFSKTETALAVGLGTLIGGGLGGAQEAVSALRARGAPPEAIASAEASAQFSDIVHAETAARERAVFSAEDPSMRSADTPAPSRQPTPADALPPVPEGHVRMFHGGSAPAPGETRWTNPEYQYARDYRSSGKPNDVFYVDVPEDHPSLVGVIPAEDLPYVGGKQRYMNSELSPDLAAQMKPVSAPADVSPEPRPMDAEAVVADPEGAAAKAAEVPKATDEDPLAALERGLEAGVADVKAGRPAPQQSTPYAPPPEQPRQPPAVPTPLEERVLRAVREVGKANDMGIDIYDVRALLPDVPRADLDGAFLSLQQKNLALLTQLSDPKDLRVKRKAGVDFGAGEQHVVSIQPDGKRVLGGQRGEGTTGRLTDRLADTSSAPLPDQNIAPRAEAGKPEPVLVRQNFDPAAPPKKPGQLDRRAYKIVDGDKEIGDIVISVTGDVAEVRSINSEVPGVFGVKDLRGGLGTKAVSSLLRQFLKENPQINRLTGERVSGARRGGNYFNFAGSGEQVDIPISRIRRNLAEQTGGKPLSLTQFIARNGGLALDGEASARDLGKVFIPGGGPLARARGKTIDGFWRESLIEHGYLPADADGMASRNIERELFDAIDRERGGDRIYSLHDEAPVASEIDNLHREVEAQAKTIAKALDEVGITSRETDGRTLTDAAELLHRGDETDPLAAYERAVMMRDVSGAEPNLTPEMEEYAALQFGTAQDGGGEAGGASRSGAGSGSEDGSSRQGGGLSQSGEGGRRDDGLRFRKGDGDTGAGQPPQSGDVNASGGPAEIGPVLSLQQQAQALADALDVPLRQGRVAGGKKGLGQYDVGQDVVRTKSIADFSTVAHEAGHALEKRIGDDLTNLINRHSNELGRLDYDATRLDAGEGFAEWLRGALTNPAYGEKQAPEFAKAFREFMTTRDPKMLGHLDEAAAAHQAWLNAPSDMKLEAIVRPPLTEWQQAVSEIKGENMAQTVGLVTQKVAGATYEALFDDKAPVARAVRSMVKAIRDATGARVSLQGGDNPETLARLFSRAQQAAVRDMLDGVRPYRGVVPEGPSMRDALITATGEPGILGRWNEAKVASFDQYLVARRSEVLYGKVARGEMERRPLAMSAVDISKAIVDAEAANPGFREASEQIHAFTRQLLRKQFEGGLIDADLYARLMAEEFYTPLFRHMDDKPSPAGVGGSDGPGTVQTIKRMRGSDRDIIPPTQSLMTQAFLVNRTLAHNDIIKSFVQLARRAKEAGAEGVGRILEEIPATQMMGKQFDLSEAVASKAREAGMDRDDLAVLNGALADLFGADPLMATIFRSEPAGKRGEPITFWKEGGQLRAVRMQSKDEGLALYEALSGLPPVQSDLAMQIAAASSTALRAGITTNPVFALTNYMRDQLAVSILRPGYVPVISGLKGAASEIKQDRWAQLYAYGGGVSPGAGAAGLSELVERDINALARRGWGVQRVASIGDLARGNILAGLRGVSETISVAESATRLSVFQTVFKQKKGQGLSDYDALIEAAHTSTDLMDFGRHGSGTAQIRSMVTFLNAHMQSLDKARRHLFEPLWRATRGEIITDADQAALRNAGLSWGLIGLSAGAGVGYGLWGATHEAYQDANVELRASHLIIPGGALGMEGKVLVVPKPFELAMGFNLGEALGTYLATKDPRSAGFALDGVREVLQPPNPLTGIPLVKTATELTMNRSFFTGRDIVPERLLNKENPRFEVKPTTTALAKQIGDTLNISPIKVDYAVGSMFGNWGRDIMAASNVTDPNAPAASKEDQMFFRRFIKGADRTSETTRQWWEAAGRQNGTFVQANNRYGDLLKAFQDSQAADYLASLPAAQKAYVILNNAAREGGKASFNSDDKRLSPLMRGADAVTVANDYIQELSRNAQRAYESGERVTMDPNKRRDVIEAVRTLSAMEQRNALVMLKQKGYEGRPLLSTEDQFKVLSAISPEAGAEIATRYATAKILPTATVARLWPEAEKRLLASGSEADIRELAIDGKGDGYAFDGERVKKPPKRRVVIDPTIPPPRAGRVPNMAPNPFE